MQTQNTERAKLTEKSQLEVTSSRDNPGSRLNRFPELHR